MSKQNRETGRTQRAAAIRAEQARKERNRRIAVVVGIVVALGAIVVVILWLGIYPQGLLNVAEGASDTILQAFDKIVKVRSTSGLL